MDEDLFVLDASVTINILGSGFEEQIFSTIPGGWVVVQNVSKETFRHPLDPSKTGDLLRTFVSRGLIRRVDIPGDAAMRYYELVGPPHDLDDGEASAIAVAEHFSGTLVIDEAKGRRVASSSPACRKILSSVDLFRHPEIAEALGSDLPEVRWTPLSRQS